MKGSFWSALVRARIAALVLPGVEGHVAHQVPVDGHLVRVRAAPVDERLELAEVASGLVEPAAPRGDAGLPAAIASRPGRVGFRQVTLPSRRLEPGAVPL